MQIGVNIKQLGKKKDKIGLVNFEIQHSSQTVKSFIGEIVTKCVESFNEQTLSGDNVTNPLSEDEIDKMSELGKIAFGIHFNCKLVDAKDACEIAWQAYEDGFFRIFWGDLELGELSNVIEIAEGDEFTFVKLTMLSGSIF